VPDTVLQTSHINQSANRSRNDNMHKLSDSLQA